MESYKQRTVGIIFYLVLSTDARMRFRNTASWFSKTSVKCFEKLHCFSGF